MSCLRLLVGKMLRDQGQRPYTHSLFTRGTNILLLHCLLQLFSFVFSIHCVLASIETTGNSCVVRKRNCTEINYCGKNCAINVKCFAQCFNFYFLIVDLLTHLELLNLTTLQYENGFFFVLI